MGLDVSHDCWSGAYSAFNRFRTKICEVAGYGVLSEREGFGGQREWPDVQKDPLVIFLAHSDCEGEIEWKDCSAIADRLESLLAALEISGEGGGHIGNYVDRASQFAAGLRDAFAAKENVEFY